jgi:fructose-1,6-bisphosphatase/inositol monophosphatase family enzyme
MRFDDKGMALLQAIIAEAAATEIMPRFRQIDTGDIRQKSSAIDLVTDADEQAEWRMRDAMANAFPTALFVGEESVARDATLLGKIKDADLCIIVDPVDGTSNFAWGLPLFGVLCAVVANGETIAGLNYDPVGKDWVLGQKGAGAHRISATGKREALRVMPPAPLADMIGLSSWYLLDEPARTTLATNLAKTHASFSYRCAAHEYRLLICGQVHYAVFPKLMPWDHAAGVLLHNEAGGHTACFDGTPYSPTIHKGGILLAPDKASWDELKVALL